MFVREALLFLLFVHFRFFHMGSLEQNQPPTEDPDTIIMSDDDSNAELAPLLNSQTHNARNENEEVRRRDTQEQRRRIHESLLNLLQEYRDLNEGTSQENGETAEDDPDIFIVNGDLTFRCRRIAASLRYSGGAYFSLH